MSDRELLDEFDNLFLGSNKRTLLLARLGANRGGVVSVETPTPVDSEVFISLGPNGEQGQSVAIDAIAIDRTAIGQQLWVRRELNKWVIYRAEFLAVGEGGGGGATTLNALTDVDTSSKVDGSILQWDATIGQWIPYSASGEAGLPHPLSDVGVGALHTGDLHDDQAPQFLMVNGSRPLTGDLDVVDGVSIDGVDLDLHAANPDAHHDHATAGNAGITVSASPTQLVSLNLLPTTSGLQIDPTGVRVKEYNGIARTSNGIGILIRPPINVLKVDGAGLYLDDSVAGPGLSINPTTKVLSVKPGEGLEIDPVALNDEVQVNKGHSFVWTGTHQFNQLTTFNNNIHFMGGDRIVTATNTLTLNPTTDLWLDPGGIIVMPTVQTYRSFDFNDFVGGIEGFLNEHTISKKRYLRIAKIKADELHVRVFTADEQRVSRGAEFWARSFGIVEEGLPGEDFFTVPAIGATVDVWFEEASDLLPDFGLFIPNNWLQFRTLDQTTGLITQNVWFQIVDADAAGTKHYVAREAQTAPTVQPPHVARQKWRLIRRGGGFTGMPIHKGNVGVEYGLPKDYTGPLLIGQTPGQGVVHLSALADDDGPFVQIQIFETVGVGGGEQIPSFSNRVRMGNLRNTLDYTTDVFGFAAGDNLATVPAGDYSTFRGIVAEATNGMRLFNTDMHLYNGSIRVLGVTRNDGLIMRHDVDGLVDARRHVAWFDDLGSMGSVPRTVLGSYVFDNGGVTTRQLEMFVTTQSTTGASIVAIRALEPSASRNVDLLLRSRGQLSTGATGSTFNVFANEIELMSRVLVGSELNNVPTGISILQVSENSGNANQLAGFTVQQRTTGSTGDAVMHWHLSVPGKYVSAGIDNSDGDKFKITYASSLGASSGAFDFFIYDPVTNLVTLSGLTGGGGGGGTPTVLSGDGIAVTGGGPYVVNVDGTVVRTTLQNIVAGAGLAGGGFLNNSSVTLSVNPGSGLKLASGVPGAALLIALHAIAPGLNITDGLQLDATVAGDGLEWTTGTSRVMQASLGNGLVFTGTNPARDITIRLRTLSPGSGLGVTTDGLFIQRRNSSSTDSGIMMGTVEGIYLADTVAGDGLEWTTSSERIMQVSLGVGLEFTGTTPARDVQINLAALGSGMLVDANGLRLNPLVAGSGLEYIYLTGTGVLRILPGPGITVLTNTVEVDLGTNPGLSTSSGLYVLLPVTGSGLVRDSTGLHLNSTVAGDGLIFDTATGEINVVPFNASLIVRASDMYVNLAHNWVWSGDHTFNTGTVRFNTTPDVNANLNFVSARTVTSTGNLTMDITGNLTFTPSGELVLNPAGTVTLFTAKTFATSSHTDTPTAITGMWVYDRGANEYHMNITSLKMDELHTRVFVADEVRVDRGEEYWSKSFGIVEEEFSLPNVGLTRDVWFENSPALSELAPNLFSVDDWLLMRTVDTSTGMLIREIWFKVVALVVAGTAANKRQQWRLEKITGGPGTLGRVRKGTFMLDAGQVGQGWVHLLAYKEMGGPYIQVGDFSSISGGTTPVHTNRVRMGNLNGVAGITGTFWGFAAGNDLGQSPLSGNFSGFTVGKGIGLPGTNYDGLRLYNTAINMYTGSNKDIALTQANGLVFDLDTFEYANPTRYLSWWPNVDVYDPFDHVYVGAYQSGGVNHMVLHNISDNPLSIIRLEAEGTSGYSSFEIRPALMTFIVDGEGFLTASPAGVKIGTSLGVGIDAPVSPIHIYEHSSGVGTTTGLTIQQNSTGDSLLHFLLTGVGTRRWMLGVDNAGNSVGGTDPFVISSSGNLSTSPEFVLAADGGLVLSGTLHTPTLYGTTAANGDIVIEGTSSATKATSFVLLQPTGGLVGIGTTSPPALFTVSADGASSTIMVASYGPSFSASLLLYSANGSEAAPTATLSGDLIGQVSFQGWDTARSTGASIRAYAAAGWGTGGLATDDPTNLSFWTVPDGSSTQVERLTVLSNGNVGIGNPAPGSLLDVAGTMNVTGMATVGGLTTSSLYVPTLYGTTVPNGNISIEGTSNVNKATSYVLLQPTGGNVGIGTLTPLTVFHLEGQGASQAMMIGTYGGGAASSSQLLLYTANGTQAAPTATLAGDLLGQIIFQGFDTARSSGASIRAVAAGEWGTAGDTTDNPTTLSFWTTPEGSGTQEERLTILASGNVGIANPAPAFTLDVTGTLNVTGIVTLSNLTVLHSTANEVARFVTLAGASGTIQGEVSIGFDGRTGGGTTPGAAIYATEFDISDNRHNLSLAVKMANDATTTPTKVLTVRSDNGFVGIGQNFVAPAALLHLREPFVGLSAPVMMRVEATDPGGYAILQTMDDGGKVMQFGIFNSTITGTTFGEANAGRGAFIYNGLTNMSMGTSTNTELWFATNNLRRMTIGGAGNVGIGSTTLTPKLHIEDTVGSLEHLWLTSRGNAPTLHLRRANTSAGIIAGDVIGQIAASGRYDGTSFSQAARGIIRFVAKAGWTSTSQDTSILFLTTSGISPITAAVFEILPNGTFLSTGTYGNTTPLASPSHVVSIDALGVFTSRDTWASAVTHSQSRPVWTDPDGVVGHYAVHGKTSTGGVALLVNSSHVYGTTTSARRFKEQIEDMSQEVAERIIAGLRPITYVGKDDEAKLKQFGFIAEEVHELGAKELVAYEDGDPFSLYYERFIVPLIMVVQRQEKRIQALEMEKRRLM